MSDFVFTKKLILNSSYKFDIFNYPKLRERFKILKFLERPSPNFAAPFSPKLFELFEVI